MLLSPLPLFGQNGSQTAEELLASATTQYNAGEWNAAEQSFRQFLTDFGASPQAAPTLPRIKPLLALCQVRLQKFTEAGPLIEECLREISQLPANQKEELSFWRGISLLQAQSYDEASETLRQFAKDYPASVRRTEAQILAGTALVVQEKFADAAAYFTALESQLRGVERGRAVLLRLYSLNHSEQLDAALALLAEESTRTHEMIQLAAYQMLALDLGAKFLEKEEYRKAIAAFQRVWPRERVLKHQEKRLQVLRERLAALEMQKADAQWTFQLSQLITKIDRELKSFREIQHYDSGLRLRIASAFQGMGRYREAALSMEEMLREMQPDPMVEQASINLLQCWSEVERWPRVVECADEFEKKFPKSKFLPTAYFLKGNAQQNDLLYVESIKTFDLLVKKFPKDPLAPRAFFMRGFGQLLLEDNKAAIKTFEEFPKRYGSDPMSETALYWRGMAYSLAKEHETSREIFADYLTRYKEGKYVGEATFRRAYSAQSLKNYATAIQELRAYLEKYPEHANNDEAALLLGDALLNEGDWEGGVAAYKSISPEATRFYEEGWFKVGKVLRQTEELDTLRLHMIEFRDRFPNSPKVAEAIYWIGWVHREKNEPEQARAAYWEAIREWGNDPKIVSVEDLFPALAKLYKGAEEKVVYRQLLKDLREESLAKEESTLAFRALWAEAQAIRREEPNEATALLAEAAKSATVDTTSPLLLADIADALRMQGRLQEAEALYLGLLKWNPRAPQKDRALAGLGLISLKLDREKAALDFFERFENETSGSMLFSEVLLHKAELQSKRGLVKEAQSSLEKLLADKAAHGKTKADALCRLGEMRMREGKPDLAIPYFQKVYITYGRWGEFVAQAYLRSGEAFEALQDKEAATKTYSEFLAREDLAIYSEPVNAARERLEKLTKQTGGNI